MRVRVAFLLMSLVLASAASAGCVKNMGELKTALGYGPDAPTPPPPPPPAKPPVAKATANATSALVGVPIKFTAAGSRDPQELPLDYQWDFGDGLKTTGATVTHVYSRVGTFRITLTATNSEDLSDTDTIDVTIRPGNRAPVAAFTASKTTVQTAESILFTSTSADPDGDALSFEWDFGDGQSSTSGAPSYSYGVPGVYVVRLTVKDRAGLAAEASKAIAVNYNQTFKGEFGPQELPQPPAQNVTKSHEFPLVPAAATLTVRLTFDAGNGLNELALKIFDAKKTRVTADETEVEPFTQGTVVKEVVLPSEALKGYEPGKWTLSVVKNRGVQIAYTIEVLETV